MPDERMTLDELLAKQAEPAPLFVTIEPIDGSDDLVKVTPYNASAGCSCTSSMKLGKQIIEWVRPTGLNHVCCGKRLPVVEVGLTDSTWTEVFRQLAEQDAARKSSPLQATSPIISAAIGAAGIGTPSELGTGASSERNCRIARDQCRKTALLQQGEEMRALAACVCDEQYQQCLDPRYRPIDCSQAIGAP